MDNYVKCLKCQILIPSYYHHTHVEECHKRHACSQTHPFIKGKCMSARLCIIEKSASNSGPSSQTSGYENRPKVKESDSIARLNFNFSHEFALFNNVDLLQLGIEAFTFILIGDDQDESIFIPVPCDKMSIGSVGLYEEGILKKLHISENISFVRVNKLENPKLAGQITLKALDCTDSETVKVSFKRKFMSYCVLGVPSIVKSRGILQLEDLQCSIINVEYEVEEKTGDNDILSDFEISKVNQSPFISDSSHSLQSSSAISDLTESFNSLKICKKALEISNKNILFDSSTPVKSRAVEVPPQSPKTFSSTFSSPTPNVSFATSTPVSTPKTSDLCQPSRDEVKRLVLTPTQDQLTVTPTSRNSTRAGSSKRSDRRRSKIKNKEDSSSSISEESIISPQNFFLVTKNTKILIANDDVQKEVKGKNSHCQFFKTEAYREIKELIEKKLSVCDNVNLMRILWTGILLSGFPGTGKTVLVEEISFELNLPLVPVTLLGWSEESFSETYFEDKFNQAKQLAPSILLLDELDSLYHLEGGQSTGAQSSSGINTILRKMEELSKPVMLIGTTNQPHLLPDHLKKVNRFDRQVIMSLPEPPVRHKIIWQILQNCSHEMSEKNAKKLAFEASGFSGADLESAVRVAWLKAVTRAKESEVPEKELEFSLKEADLREGIESVVPYFLRQNYFTVSKVNWSDIYGYEDVKEKFRKVLTYQCDSEQELKGVLLYGPPGCSKTMLVRALATETKFTYFPLKCSNLLSKYVGETEKRLGKVFEKASYSCPSLIFMDEIDSLCGDRSSKGDTSNIVPELLSLLKNCNRKKRILVIGATNRPQAVDEALFSPGCLELLLHVDLPDCQSRCSIWQGLLRGIPKAEIDIKVLCTKTERFSCAEISAIYQKATHHLLDILHSKSKSVEQLLVNQQLLLDTISKAVPQTPKPLLKSIEVFKNSFRSSSL